MIRIVIEGDVIPAARPRFSNRRCYQPKRNQEYRQKVQTAARLAMKGAEPLTDEICAAVKIYRKYKRSSRIFGDVDNHIKAIFDALNGVVFVDDSQICRCVVEKYQDKAKPRAEIEIANIC